jgi:hypothetical protein
MRLLLLLACLAGSLCYASQGNLKHPEKEATPEHQQLDKSNPVNSVTAVHEDGNGKPSTDGGRSEESKTKKESRNWRPFLLLVPQFSLWPWL